MHRTGWANSTTPTMGDPGVKAACGAEPADCYCAVQSTSPSICPGGVVAGLWRKSGSPPPGDVVRFQCQTP